MSFVSPFQINILLGAFGNLFNESPFFLYKQRLPVFRCKDTIDLLIVVQIHRHMYHRKYRQPVGHIGKGVVCPGSQPMFR